MADSSAPRSLVDTFQIQTPDQNESVCAALVSTVLVRVNNLDSGNTRFEATITDVSGGGGTPTDLLRQGTSNLWSNQVFAGNNLPTNPPTANNKTVAVQAFQGVSAGERRANDFKASFCGSGSLADSSLDAKAALQTKFAQKDQPIPVALSLQLDSKVSKGTCAKCSALNRPTQLVFSHDPKYPHCWLSEPIILGAKGAGPSFWILEKKSARAWTLKLRHDSTLVVTYVLKTKGKKDATFPIQLLREGRGGRECTKWPKTVSISPAT